MFRWSILYHENLCWALVDQIQGVCISASTPGQPCLWACPWRPPLCTRRRESEELKAAAAPTKASGPAAVPLVSDAASSELAARLKLRAQKLAQELEQQ